MAKRLSRIEKAKRFVKNLVNKIISNDIVVRASKTFLQTFTFTVIAGLAGVNNVDSGLALLLGAGSAGLSAVWNTVKEHKK